MEVNRAEEDSRHSQQLLLGRLNEQGFVFERAQQNFIAEIEQLRLSGDEDRKRIASL